MPWPKGKPRVPAIPVAPAPVVAALVHSLAPEVRLTSFKGVRFDDTLPMIGGHVGLATSSTSYFSAAAGYEITLNPETQIVTVSKNKLAICVPLYRVKFLEP